MNDELVAEFTVVLLGNNETVEMEIFDLSGHLVRQLTQTREASTDVAAKAPLFRVAATQKASTLPHTPVAPGTAPPTG